jgi:Arc/MetJ family transcription regulator
LGIGNRAAADVVEELLSDSRLMRTTIDIDDSLMREAMSVGELTTKKAVVEAALRLFIQTKSQVGMRRFRGKVQWEGNLDVSRRGRILPSQRSKGSQLDVKGAKLKMPAADSVAIVRQGRERE